MSITQTSFNLVRLLFWETFQFAAGFIFFLFKLISLRKIQIYKFEDVWLVVKFYAGSLYGISLGKFIFINTPSDNPENWKNNMHGNPLVWHEFGHSIDSKRLGPLYLFLVGIPSLISAWKNKPVWIEGKRYYTHDLKSYEIRANHLANEYRRNKYNQNWDEFSEHFPTKSILKEKKFTSDKPYTDFG